MTIAGERIEPVPTPANAADRESCPLDQLGAGLCAVVVELTAAPEEAQRLKAMGVCTGRLVTLLKPGDPLILRVLATRIGISGRLAATVRVAPCDDPRCTVPGQREESPLP